MAFYGSFRENSLLVHFDVAASLSNFSAFRYGHGQIELLEYGWDMKDLANFFNDNALSFAMIRAGPGEHTSVPGKLMGYASWGKYNNEIERWLVSHNYFKEYWHRDAEIIDSARESLGAEVDSFDNQNSFWHDVVATLQHIFTREFMAHITVLQQQTGDQYFYYVGGCALNIVVNATLIQSVLFQEVFIPHCSNDSGLSLGAACLLELKKGHRILPHTPYLNNIGLKYNFTDITDETIEATAKLLLNGKILGVYNENAEVGPRALGHRSLIALPNDLMLAQHLSKEIKKESGIVPLLPLCFVP